MIDIKLLDIIACPICKGKLSFKKETHELICKFDHLAFPVIEGIPALLRSKARVITADEEL
ncbi:Trm112 family protein [Psychromonas sp. CD1]|uniref:Trm112 family protein n=1 Tax=Psychromonas sp. CD1 TaxID=1979839 RepID=UPI0015DAE2D0|nr:Trm112 family protein [Psychromonas sp. CD1]